MEFLRDLDIALLISGKERIFCYVDISSLESRLKQLQSGASISDINSHQIEKVKSCHLFSVAMVTTISLLTSKLNLLSLFCSQFIWNLKKNSPLILTVRPLLC